MSHDVLITGQCLSEAYDATFPAFANVISDIYGITCVFLAGRLMFISKRRSEIPLVYRCLSWCIIVVCIISAYLTLSHIDMPVHISTTVLVVLFCLLVYRAEGNVAKLFPPQEH